MDQQTKKYYTQLYTHKNNIPQAPQNEHITHKELIVDKLPYHITKNNITYTNKLPLYKITRGQCPECNCKTYSYDQWRGEKVCPQCGLVLEENRTNYKEPLQPRPRPLKTLTYEDKKFLKKLGHKHYTANKKEWTHNYNNITIQTLSNQAQLNKKQKIETQYIIDTLGFKKLHSRATKPEIIAGVIRYVMKQTYSNQAQLRYNQGIFKNLLTKEIYNIIERNIKKHLYLPTLT